MAEFGCGTAYALARGTVQIPSSAGLILVVAVMGSALACAEDDHGPPSSSDTEVGTYRRLRRLSVREYTRVVADLLGEDIDPKRFTGESLDTGYDNGPANLTISDEEQVYESLAFELGGVAVQKHLDRVLGPCVVTVQGEAACKRAFFEGFATRAFRRPLEPDERARMERLFDEARTIGGGFSAALETTVSALLQSPGFLYREELGGAPAGSTVHLTPYEMASELSFFLTGSMPDDTLLQAARDGTLSTPADLRREGARLLATPRGREQLAHFLDGWLVTTRLSGTTKDHAAYPAFDAKLLQSMREELDRDYADVMANGGTLQDLFTSNVSFVDGRLARLYGLPAPNPDANAFQKVSLDPATRSGIMTRAGFLTVNSGYDYSNPIERGIFVRNAVLCIPPRPPPPNIPRNPSADGAKTTRQRFEQHTANPFCQTCHQGIDGVGFGFEQFDGLGVLRTSEDGVPVDTSGFLHDSGDADGPFLGVAQLEDRIAQSAQMDKCFVRQMFRYAMGRGENARDQGSLSNLSRGFSAQTPIGELALRIVEDRAFRERTKAEE
ncbi:DUF1592 domain-containing protein [Pendulispora brunnea]|uniref:DUF1592 domain-containing protein n=1 Tax=Pendulispora brunnea TaxID=2905690 RepID=A0ABZ2JXJ7_9BACT